MKRIFFRLAVCLSAVFTPMQPAAAQSTEYEKAQLVTQRQPLMFDLQSAYFVLLDVQSGRSTDYKAAAEAARGMAAIMDRFVALMPPGTARGEAPGTRAKPEIWTEAETFAAMVQNFKDSAQSMADVAAAGDPGDYRAEFEAFTGACTSCHGLRPSSGGYFRFAVGE